MQGQLCVARGSLKDRTAIDVRPCRVSYARSAYGPFVLKKISSIQPPLRSLPGYTSLRVTFEGTQPRAPDGIPHVKAHFHPAPPAPFPSVVALSDLVVNISAFLVLI